MAVSNTNYYDPDSALHELMIQEQVFKARLDTQVILQLMIKEGITDAEEIQYMREQIINNNPEYKNTKESIERQKKGFQEAKDNPQEYLKSILKAKMEGKIR